MRLFRRATLIAMLSAVATPLFANDFNLAPDCSGAQPSTEAPWPPKHSMAPVDIIGVTDPDGDAVDIAIACITQDEPLNQIGDGNTEPDASGIGTSTALVRQERAGTGNGRFYHIDYIATDAQGARCGGGVTVRVDKSKSKQAVDDGRLYLSVPTGYDCRQHDINNPPVIYTEPELSGETGSLYSYRVQAHDPDQDILNYRLTIAPEGMTIDSESGVIKWDIVPSQFGNQRVEATADDGRGGRNTQQFVVHVVRANEAPMAHDIFTSTESGVPIQI